MCADAERNGDAWGEWDEWGAGWPGGTGDVEGLAVLVERRLEGLLGAWAAADRGLRALQYRHNGRSLKRRGLADGQCFNVVAGPVRPGDLCLAASDAGELAVGVARYEPDGTFAVWSDGCGPAVRLSRGEHVRPVGLVAPVVGIALAVAGVGFLLSG